MYVTANKPGKSASVEIMLVYSCDPTADYSAHMNLTQRGHRRDTVNGWGVGGIWWGNGRERSKTAEITVQNHAKIF